MRVRLAGNGTFVPACGFRVYFVGGCTILGLLHYGGGNRASRRRCRFCVIAASFSCVRMIAALMALYDISNVFPLGSVQARSAAQII
jgi:hypothetical protein